MKKKLLISILTLSVVAALVAGGVIAQFTDEEKASATLTAGTIDIAVGDGDTFENPWEGSFSIPDIKPCQVWYIEFVIENVGMNPVVLWKHITNFETGPGTAYYPVGAPTASSEPEHAVDPDDTKNRIDKWYRYDLYSEVVYPTPPATTPSTDNWHQTQYNENVFLDEVKSLWVPLGSLPPGGKMKVIQSYHLDAETPNKHQGDTLDFDIMIHAAQLEGTTVVMENKVQPAQGGPSIVDWADAMTGTLDYSTVGSTFDYTLTAAGLIPGATYELIYYADPWPGNNPGALIGTHTADGGGAIASGPMSIDLGMDLPDPSDANAGIGAKVWLVPDADYNAATNSMVAWNEAQYLFETHCIWYNDTDVP